MLTDHPATVFFKDIDDQRVHRGTLLAVAGPLDGGSKEYFH